MMMFRASVFGLLSTFAAASINTADIAASSKLGSVLLRKATVVQDTRHLYLEQRNETFIASYSLRYLGCSSLDQVQEGGITNGTILSTQHLVRFALCPTSDSCVSCPNGGEYVVNLEDFLGLYIEQKLNGKERACEMIRKNCSCDSANDEVGCEIQCYLAEEMPECIEYEGVDEFEVQRYTKCQEMEEAESMLDKNSDPTYYGRYRVGPYCSLEDRKSIYLGVFYDEGCTAQADSGVYARRNYGVQLPFLSESLVDPSKCISCMAPSLAKENGNNSSNATIVADVCSESLEKAIRCEEKMEIDYKDASGCEFINNVLPSLDAAKQDRPSADSSSFYAGSTGMLLTIVIAFAVGVFVGLACFSFCRTNPRATSQPTSA